MSNKKYTIGIDYGTLSARAVLVCTDDGEIIGERSFEYPHGVMDSVLCASGEKLPSDFALQDPRDYLDALYADGYTTCGICFR